MQSAQGWARTQLARQYPDEHRKLYIKFKESLEGGNIRQRAASKAKTELVNKHYDDYRRLYLVAIRDGHSGTHARSKKKSEEH